MKRRAQTLLEREAELGTLRESVADAVRGAGSLCLIEGPAGVGKTALLHEARAIAEDAGMRSLAASTTLLEADLAWNVVRQLFTLALERGKGAERLLVGAASLAAAPLGLGKPSSTAGALYGLYWLTEGLCDHGPLILSVDDAQWADVPSLRYLAYLAERIGGLPVLAVMSVRSGEDLAAPLRTMMASPRVQRIAPRALSPSASAKLARSELGENAASEFCDACHAATGGNPFLLRELIVQLRSESIEPSAEHSKQIAGKTPDTVVQAVGMRLSRQPQPAQALAAALAILGDSADLRQIAELAGLREQEAARAADSLVAAGILTVDSPPRFQHPLVRDVVYESIPTYTRGAEHRRAARLRAACGDAPELIASQLLRAYPIADGWAVARLREAASIAQEQGAPHIAAELLARALAEPPPPLERPAVLAELGSAELAAGLPSAFERLAESVRLISDPRTRARTALEHGRALYVTGRPREAAEALERGHAELVQSGVEDRSLAMELRAGWLAVARTELSLRSEAAQFARAVSIDPPVGDSYGARALLAQVAGELTFIAEPRERSLALAHSALEDGNLLEEDTSDGLNWISAMGALGWGDEFDAYESLQRRAQAEARRRGSMIGFVNGVYGLSFSFYYRGMLADAEAAALRAVEAGPEGWQMFLPAARAQLAWAQAERGELKRAQGELRRARSDAVWNGSSMQALVFEAEARIHLARGELQAALEAGLQAGRVFEGGLIVNPSIVPWQARVAVAAARLGHSEQAEEALGKGLARARRFGAPRPLGVALLAAGEALKGKRSLDAFEEAVEVLAASPARLEYARALILHGAAIRRAGATKAARERLAAGLDLCASFGARPLAERARAELLAAGARPRRERSTGAESLTPAERRVVGLALEGLSNREIAEALFVSRRTVETHLTHVYRKLGVTARSELAGALAAVDADSAAHAARPRGV